MLVQGNFESNSGPKPISVRHRASRHLTYEKTRFVIVVKAPVVVLQIEFGSSDELYSVSTQIGIDRLPVYISILVYARFTKFMLNKALFVCYSNYVFEYQPFVDLFFFKAIETLGRVGRITFFKNNQKWLKLGLIIISTNVKLIWVDYTLQLVPIWFYFRLRISSRIEQSILIARGVISPIKIFSRARPWLNLIKRKASFSSPCLPIKSKVAHLFGNLDVFLASRYKTCCNHETILCCETVSVFIILFQVTFLNFVMFKIEHYNQFHCSIYYNANYWADSEHWACECAIFIFSVRKKQSKRLLVTIEAESAFLAFIKAREICQVTLSLHFLSSNFKFLIFKFLINLMLKKLVFLQN